MKHTSNSLKILGLALVIGLGVSVVSAWNAPGTGSTAPISGNVPASINISIFDQIKKGGIIIPTVNQKFISPLSFFKKTLLPGKDTSVYIGGSGDATGTLNAAGWAIQFPGNRDVPLTINLKERAKITDAIKFKTDQMCPQTTKLINTKASAFEFWNAKEDANADLIANGIRLEGGDPAPGKILIAVDAAGRAVWATPKLAANGTDVTFDTYNDSPVGLCGTPSSAPHWDLKWDGCKTVYDGSGTTNIEPGDSVEYGTATCKNSSNQTVTGCTGAPWSDMDGSTPIRAAATSLPQCSTGTGTGTDPIKSWYCHIGGGSWVDEGVSSNCHDAFSPAGYAFGDTTRVCSTVKPLDSSCVGPANNSGLPKWSDVKNQQFVCDKINNIGYWTGVSCR